jgi:hypothetical protein
MKGIMGVGENEIICIKCRKKKKLKEDDEGQLPDGWAMLALSEDDEVEDFDAAPLCPKCAKPYREDFARFEKELDGSASCTCCHGATCPTHDKAPKS